MGNVRYLIYGRSSCEYCVEACDLLQASGEEFIFFDENILYLEYVKSFYGKKTVPIILQNHLQTGEVKMVGGCSDLKELF